MKIIVGLGNPGQKYEGTRHNIGFLTVDEISRQLDIAVKHVKFQALYGEGHIRGEKIILLKPQTYMNRSGESVRKVLDYYRCPVEDLLIIYDDLDLPFGRLKLRMKGGAAGHNGLKSIIAHTQTQSFKRMKLGIGRPEDGDVTAHVLGAFSAAEKKELPDLVHKASKAAVSFIEEDFSKVMNMYNPV